jgi:hypothetical protein
VGKGWGFGGEDDWETDLSASPLAPPGTPAGISPESVGRRARTVGGLVGSTALVVAELDSSFDGQPAQPVFKGSAPGPANWFISASGVGFTLSGSVTRKIVPTG